MNQPQGSARPTHRFGGIVALFVLTVLCFGIRTAIDSRSHRGSDPSEFAESPHLVYARLLGRFQKLQHLLERIEQAEDSTTRQGHTEEYNRLAGSYNELMESMAFPFTQRSHVPPGSPGPLPRYVALRQQQ